MKTPLLLLASCLLLLVAVVTSTPVDTSNLETARQAAAGAKPPAASTDDDDDDDDDDIDLDITDDDDDDDDEDDAADDEEDDDDDEDFFERFFDDILGDDDDDDDDDTPSKPAVTPASTPVAAATQQKPVAPAISASVDYPSLDYNTAPGETADTADPSAAPLAAYDEEQAAGFASDDVAEPAAAIDASTPDVGQKPSDNAAAANTDDDEEDDDDDDELDVTLDDDDDDDDEDEDEEDDEDDEDDDDDDLSDVVGDDVIEAKRSRALENNPTSMYITKYNRFVDNILERINRILRKNYDPVNVRLHTNNEKKGNAKNNGHKRNKNRRRRPGRRPHHTSPVARATTEVVEATMNESLAAISAQLTEALQETTLQEMNDTFTTTITPTTKRSSGGNSRAQPQNNKNKKKNNTAKNRPNAKATLYGLSTMKREGDVTVNMMSSHTTVRTKFSVGPLILRVEKEFGRGAKKDIRSATATTTEMTGKMNLRVMHGGAATLHSIRVLQPRQVRVESSDDHDKTREYIWKRSSHIARVVSQKLTNATKSMLQPPPIPANGIFA